MSDTQIRKELLEILACPACDSRPRVEMDADGIRCSECGRVYPVENGVPIMLVDRATQGKPKGGQ